jgi:hypothetical protein
LECVRLSGSEIAGSEELKAPELWRDEIQGSDAGNNRLLDAIRSMPRQLYARLLMVVGQAKGEPRTAAGISTQASIEASLKW